MKKIVSIALLSFLSFFTVNLFATTYMTTFNIHNGAEAFRNKLVVFNIFRDNQPDAGILGSCMTDPAKDNACSVSVELPNSDTKLRIQAVPSDFAQLKSGLGGYISTMSYTVPGTKGGYSVIFTVGPNGTFVPSPN